MVTIWAKVLLASGGPAYSLHLASPGCTLLRFNGSAFGGHDERLFSPREQQQQLLLLQHSGTGQPRGPKRGSGTGGIEAAGYKASMGGMPSRSGVVAESALFQPDGGFNRRGAAPNASGGGGGGGGDNLRQRRNAAPSSRSGKSPSRRAVVPINDDE